MDVGPVVSTTYPLGYFKEDYEFVGGTEPDVLDEHNGRFCVTPEYPDGFYCYFATVDENWNSAYPYVVGPTFYGTVTGSKVQTISEAVTNYNPASAVFENGASQINTTIFPNPSSDFIAIQVQGLLQEKMEVKLFDLSGKMSQQTTIQPGSTISYLDTRTMYSGTYLVSYFINGKMVGSDKVVLQK